jgi:hypothetical protein
MELTNGEIINSIHLVRLLAEAELPAVSSIRISRSLKELEEQQQIIQEARQDIIKKHQATNGEGEPLFEVSEAQARNDRVKEIASEKEVEPEEVNTDEVEVDLPDKAPESHDYATQQPYITKEAQEAVNEELNSLFEDTVDVEVQALPADELEKFENAFYEVLESSNQVDIDRAEDAEGFRPGDIAPITYLFPQDL